MDETTVASKSKYRKPNEQLDVDAVAYNINDLPEAILEHILSFVPMKDAVRTCVLSKRWRYIWTSYPNLELSEEEFSNSEHFTNFVERVLVLRGTSRINRFVLSCDALDNASRVNLWVSAAVKLNLQECFVYLSETPRNFVLSYCLFTCATLTHLKLSIRRALKLPSRIWLPNLKLLHLENITFVDEHSNEQLLSSPVLEELTIEHCYWNNLKTLSIRAPMLKMLTIRDFLFWSPPPYSCRVLISGNNLESIHFISPFLNDYQVEKSCSLLELHIHVPECRSRSRQVAYRLNKHLKAMRSVKKLTLSSTAVEYLSRAAELCLHLPVFPNLKSMNLGCLDLQCQVIIKLLHNAPHLETLQFSQGIEPYPSDDADGFILDPTPRCFGSHLRQIKLIDVILRKEEVRILELFLKHAMVLEKLVICPFRHHLEQGIEEKFRKMLLEIDIGSKSLEIAFFYRQRPPV